MVSPLVLDLGCVAAICNMDISQQDNHVLKFKKLARIQILRECQIVQAVIYKVGYVN